MEEHEHKKDYGRLGTRESLFHEGKRRLFLSDWAKLMTTEVDDLLHTASTTSLKGEKFTSQELAGEIKALALSVLKLNKIEKVDEVESILRMQSVGPSLYNYLIEGILEQSFVASWQLRTLLGKMLSLNPAKPA